MNGIYILFEYSDERIIHLNYASPHLYHFNIYTYILMNFLKKAVIYLAKVK